MFNNNNMICFYFVCALQTVNYDENGIQTEEKQKSRYKNWTLVIRSFAFAHRQRRDKTMNDKN